MTQCIYFKQLTTEEQNRLAMFDQVSAEDFATLTELAKEEYKKQEIATKPKFEDITAWTSSSNICGFYFLSRETLRHSKTSYKLLAIAFKELYEIDFENHTKTLTGYKPIAIYQDSNGYYYTTHTSTLDLRPLEKWQRKLQNNINEYSAKIDALKRIQRNYKKDGKPFQRIQQNFTNCTITERYTYTHEFEGYNITYYYIDKYHKEGKIYGTAQHQIKTIDDVIPAIENYIKDFDGYIKEYQRLLNFSTVIYNEVMGDIHKSILKYQTPSNNLNITIDYFKHTVEEWFKDCYLNI